jgi:hypothetical protein
MGLFRFNFGDGQSGFVIAKQWWWYIILAFPLTVGTYFAFNFAEKRQTEADKVKSANKDEVS